MSAKREPSLPHSVPTHNSGEEAHYEQKATLTRGARIRKHQKKDREKRPPRPGEAGYGARSGNRKTDSTTMPRGNGNLHGKGNGKQNTKRPLSFAHDSGRPPGTPAAPREQGNGKCKMYKGKGSSFEYEAGRPPGNPGEPEVLAATASIGRAASDRTSAMWPWGHAAACAVAATSHTRTTSAPFSFLPESVCLVCCLAEYLKKSEVAWVSVFYQRADYNAARTKAAQSSEIDEKSSDRPTFSDKRTRHGARGC